MSKHLASLRWNRNGKPFTYEGYSLSLIHI